MRMISALFALAIASSIAHANDIAAGQKLVEDNCSRCHAIGKTGESPLAKAPTFREVVTRYPPESLGEALVEGIVTGHNEMPEFVFESAEASCFGTLIFNKLQSFITLFKRQQRF